MISSLSGFDIQNKGQERQEDAIQAEQGPEKSLQVKCQQRFSFCMCTWEWLKIMGDTETNASKCLFLGERALVFILFSF
jgi:hypothetical protein